MPSYQIENYQSRIIIDCLEERRGAVLTKLDKVRRMKDVLDDDLYHTVIQSHHIEVQLLTDTILTLTPDA